MTTRTTAADDFNVGRTDRTIRITLGILLIVLGLALGSWWGALGLIPLLTGFISWCPLYALLGISTFKAPGEGPARMT